MLHNLKQHFICFFFLINKVLFSTYQIRNYNTKKRQTNAKQRDILTKKCEVYSDFALFFNMYRIYSSSFTASSSTSLF